jgi:hypothetical protein
MLLVKKLWTIFLPQPKEEPSPPGKPQGRQIWSDRNLLG